MWDENMLRILAIPNIHMFGIALCLANYEGIVVGCSITCRSIANPLQWNQLVIISYLRLAFLRYVPCRQFCP